MKTNEINLKCPHMKESCCHCPLILQDDESQTCKKSGIKRIHVYDISPYLLLLIMTPITFTIIFLAVKSMTQLP